MIKCIKNIAFPVFMLFALLAFTGCGPTTPSGLSGLSADFIVSPESPAPNQEAQFSDRSRGNPTSWSWNFDDGETSTLQNPTHVFADIGSYNVTLLVSNVTGTARIQKTVTVTNAAEPAAYTVVDTGQLAFYGNGPELASAPVSSSDPFYGQDAQFSVAQPAYRNNNDGTITDLNTGLMWVAARGPKVSWIDAVAHAASCRVGGYSDWRMPTLKELYSLIKFTGKSGLTDADSIPYIDTNYFEIVFGDATGGRVIDGQDWTATQYVSTTMRGNATVFGVNFIDGRIKGYPKTDPRTGLPHTLYVRYVRGNSSYGKNLFTDNGNGTITDAATGLMWSKDDSGTGMNWQDALAWVQEKNREEYLGHNDWRLPNAKELQSIVDYTRSPDTTHSAAIAPLFSCTTITNEGGAADYPWYWTGTTHLDNGGAVYIAFGRALGYMPLYPNDPTSPLILLDVHGAGAQRSDPKDGSPADYPLGQDINGNTVYGRGPQGDVIRIENFIRLVRDAR